VAGTVGAKVLLSFEIAKLFEEKSGENQLLSGEGQLLSGEHQLLES